MTSTEEEADDDNWTGAKMHPIMNAIFFVPMNRFFVSIKEVNNLHFPIISTKLVDD